jgi:3-hydroxyisobutyrate dehydrogenase-like beta-hydroxyacid dehydrogenase
MPSIAYLGTGLLGSAFVEAALGRGDQVTVWNRTAAKAQALAALGARVAANPAEAGRGAERVHLVLQDDAVVDAVIDQLRPGLERGAVIVDHSTTQPALTAVRAERLAGLGVAYLHCPVFIGPAAARRSQGIIMASGPRALFDRVSPALAKQAAQVEYLGERPDLAAAYKLAGNAFIVGLTALVADVFQVAGGAGVASADALKLFEFFNPMALIAWRAKALVAKDFRPSFELTMARKDVRLMLETASPAVPLLLPAIAARMDALIAEGEGAKDMAVIGRDAVR